MDIIIQVPHIPKVGETILATGVKTAFGGKGSNQAAGIGKLDGDITMIGCVGNDENGNLLTDSLKKCKVNTEGLMTLADTSTGVAYINLSYKGENNIVVNGGANNRLTVEQFKKKEAVLNNAGICVTQLETPIETVEYIAKLCLEQKI